VLLTINRGNLDIHISRADRFALEVRRSHGREKCDVHSNLSINRESEDGLCGGVLEGVLCDYALGANRVAKPGIADAIDSDDTSPCSDLVGPKFYPFAGKIASIAAVRANI